MAKQNQIKSEKAGEFTFGVEIECFVPTRSGIQATSYYNPAEVEHGFPSGWKIKTDGSLAIQARGFRPVEIISPVLTGIDGLQQVVEVANRLESIGAEVNRTCGFHVHVGAKSVAGDKLDNIAGWVSNLINLVGQHELALFASTGSAFRAKHCRYTKSIKRSYTRERRDELKKKKWEIFVNQVTGIDRYHSLNIQNLFRQDRMTVEFRVFAGTVSAIKMLGHIQMALGLCEKALGPAVPFNAPRTRIYRGGDGAKSLERLLFLLGWNLGRKDVGKTDCSALGWIADLDQVKDVKTELRRLANKFDLNSQN